MVGARRAPGEGRLEVREQVVGDDVGEVPHPVDAREPRVPLALGRAREVVHRVPHALEDVQAL